MERKRRRMPGKPNPGETGGHPRVSTEKAAPTRGPARHLTPTEDKNQVRRTPRCRPRLSPTTPLMDAATDAEHSRRRPRLLIEDAASDDGTGRCHPCCVPQRRPRHRGRSRTPLSTPCISDTACTRFPTTPLPDVAAGRRYPLRAFQTPPAPTPRRRCCLTLRQDAAIHAAHFKRRPHLLPDDAAT
jgi:hypothetical protein